ncbi:hypothetical protein [Candidatus Amarobacter glycogenicus]|uniref:hypothetical protein n=1 Tax=Candidatus Amarobacter glycogenicus TaxID=3140699 RepID=UPI002A0CDA0B|nr:hypothetical protein [Dehalococcoidia bacterium]
MNTLYIDIDDTLVTWLSEEDAASAKFNPGVEEGDLFIDDSPFDAWKHACIHPRDLSS